MDSGDRYERRAPERQRSRSPHEKSSKRRKSPEDESRHRARSHQHSSRRDRSPSRHRSSRRDRSRSRHRSKRDDRDRDRSSSRHRSRRDRDRSSSHHRSSRRDCSADRERQRSRRERSSSRSRVPKPSRDERVNEDNEGDAWVEKSAESRPKPITSKPQPTEADDPSDDEIGPLPPSGGLPTNSPADPPAPTHLSKLEAAGYVLSGSRHKRMAALRAKATSKILTEEDKKKKVQERLEERTRKEEVILEGFRSMVRERQQGENKEESK
ncbi:hypothetical protein SAICODRAFT_73214 [Saitoella complicata NRRL Y-17804]|uniref:NF-kappa-B-activating protein C-terminal domain-containing protein n=1 Tax=Saitoella complicata (strain BCRC 22490 / CBS 7301 / JCM 7358 / NBRC 10748 / NRRL Y-17804) TaxID=698492 RepID=A0A0E9NDU3_SAICN|nr:uncharacterized protein SAICODRAFT_73214 [Saitoella complicata NRRL Y-17804]ODQ50717.1 hypothetical protein SAICODRAFT_73214 [Saitoella complicata NRRL Y-17804]GAO47978.1 hypothetical protein G7K_2169-t1 [Saitoella complicata NRRL Y-17804]